MKMTSKVQWRRRELRTKEGAHAMNDAEAWSGDVASLSWLKSREEISTLDARDENGEEALRREEKRRDVALDGGTVGRSMSEAKSRNVDIKPVVN